MTDKGKGQEEGKKKLTVQRLRETRKPPQENLDRRKEQRKIIKSIKETLESEPKNIPQIAEETGMRSETVAWYLFSLYKYGEIEEAEEEGEYYTYKLPAGAGAGEQKKSEKEEGNENEKAGDADED